MVNIALIQFANKYLHYWQNFIKRRNITDEDLRSILYCQYLKGVAVTQTTNVPVMQSVHNYMKEGIKKGSKADQFVTTWMRNFKIGKEFTITSIYGDSYTLVITDYSGKKMPLADKGIGSIQIMSLLLRLAVLIKKGNGEGKIVLIEEPEQNLHPTLQGQLAKLLYEINTTYGYQVIVETHSEYLVRMSQVLVSQISQDNGCKTKEELDRYNPFKIHYLPSNAPHYEIKYQINGTLDRPFGTGFYDVADELAMSLML